MSKSHTAPHPRTRGLTVNARAEFYAEVGRRVRIAREAAGLTQDALADQVDLSRTSVTNIENGRQKIALHTLCKVASVVGVEPASLLPPEGRGERGRTSHKKADRILA
jgi:transcriptional regulator with XRE-family HTH domain